MNFNAYITEMEQKEKFGLCVVVCNVKNKNVSCATTHLGKLIFSENQLIKKNLLLYRIVFAGRSSEMANVGDS